MTEDDDDDEATYLAILRPCVDGPLTAVAIDLMVRPDGASRYADCRAVMFEILEGRKKRTGRPSHLDRQAELLNRFRATRGKLNPDHARRVLRHAFSDLSDREFEAATCAKPSGRIVERANEIKGGKSSAADLRLDSDDDLTSDQR